MAERDKESRDYCSVDYVNEAAVKEARKEALAPATVNSLAETFKALGDPTRIRIIHFLAARELCVCDLASLLEISQSAVSHQLRLLRNLRLVKYRREGKIIYYSLDDFHIVNLFREGLEHVTHD